MGCRLDDLPRDLVQGGQGTGRLRGGRNRLEGHPIGQLACRSALRDLVGDHEHLLIGTSLPFLLPQGLHHLEAFSEALAGGAWGKVGGRIGERLRQAVDLEHWGAFQHGFGEVADMALSVAYGERGPAPDTVTFLSGDVHHSYVSEVRRVHERSGPRSRIVQAVCSPIRNPLDMIAAATPTSYRSALAADNLQKMGYTNVISMDGGFRGWVDAGHDVEGAS